MTEANYIAYAAACVCGNAIEKIVKLGRPRKFCDACRGKQASRTGKARVTAGSTCCAQCGSIDLLITKTGKKSKYCSMSCKWRAQTLQRKPGSALKGSLVPMDRACTCKRCGKQYQNKRGGTTGEGSTYCSRECAFADKASPSRKQNLILAAERRQQRKSKEVGWNLKVWFKTCAACGVAFTARRLSQSLCHKECHAKNKPGPTVRVCASCGEQFETTLESKRYCSKACRPDRLLKHARQRARKAGVAYEPVNAIRVFNRDGWRCQICGRRTPISRRGTNHSNAPEVDHRIPMSKGGPHTYENTQCACRECNGLKSNKSQAGQMPLFGA